MLRIKRDDAMGIKSDIVISPAAAVDSLSRLARTRPAIGPAGVPELDPRGLRPGSRVASALVGVLVVAPAVASSVATLGGGLHHAGDVAECVRDLRLCLDRVAVGALGSFL